MAITMSWVLHLLAANPEVQEWVREEIHAVVINEDPQLKYQEYYPKLNRCLAVLVSTAFRIH